MAERKIDIAASRSQEDGASVLWRALVEAWPADADGPPGVRAVGLGELLSSLRSHEPGTWRGAPQAVLAVLDQTDAVSGALALADALHLHWVPALIVVPRLGDGERGLRGGGVLLAGAEEILSPGPGRVTHAAALAALVDRQRVVLDLVRELRLANRHSGGMRGEMNRLHDELHLAASVQQELLPKSLPGARTESGDMHAGGLSGVGCGEWAVLFRPAGYVSGDIYDVVELGDGRVGFLVADVAGHGVPAALMTMVVSRSLRTTRPGPGGPEIVPPGAAMSALNDELIRGNRAAPRFATAIYGVYDARTREVTLAGAGHPPPIRVLGERVLRVPTDGPLLGVFEHEEYQQVRFELEPGETLLVFSDGFETAFSPRAAEGGEAGPAAAPADIPGERARKGDARFRAGDLYLKELAALPWPDGGGRRTLPGAMRELAARLDSQTGSLHQIDDITALALHAPRSAAAISAGAARAA